MKRFVAALSLAGILAAGVPAMAGDNDPVSDKDRYYRGSKDSLGYIRKSNGPWPATIYQRMGYDKSAGYGPYARFQDPAMAGVQGGHHWEWTYYWPRAPRFHPPYTGIYIPGIHYGYGPYDYGPQPWGAGGHSGFGAGYPYAGGVDAGYIGEFGSFGY